MSTKTYSELLKDPRWKNKRKEILARDNKECQWCQSTKKLQVHHFYYEANKKPWQYDDDMLITYCDSCHKTVTKLDADLKRIVFAQKSLFFKLELARLIYMLCGDESRLADLKQFLKTPNLMKELLNFANIVKNPVVDGWFSNYFDGDDNE